MAVNILKDVKKAETPQPVPDVPIRKNIFKEFQQQPKNVIADVDTRSVEEVPAYTIAAKIKRDALIRPDMQEFLSKVTGGMTDKFLDSNVGRDIVDVPIQGALGYMSGLTFGLPELLTSDFIWNKYEKGEDGKYLKDSEGNKIPDADRPVPDTIKIAREVLKPDSAYGEVTNNIASLFGLGGPLKLLGKLKPVAALAKLRPTTWQGVLAKRVADGGFRLGAYSLLSEHGGETLADNIKARGMSGMHGAAMGGIFSAAHGITGDVVQKAGAKFGLKITDPYTHITAFATRLGINEYFTGVQSFKKYVQGKETLPSLIYNIGLGTMFSLSSSPLKMQAEFNKTIQHKYKLNTMKQSDLATHILEYSHPKDIPADVKWAYIMKTTDGRIRPTYQTSGDFIKNEALRIENPEAYNMALDRGKVTTNVGATNHIFERVVEQNNPEIAKKFKFLSEYEQAQKTSEKVELALGDKPSIEQVAVFSTKIKQPGYVNEVVDTMTSKNASKVIRKEARVMKAIAEKYNIPLTDIVLKYDNAVLRKLVEKNPSARIDTLVEKWNNNVRKESTGRTAYQISAEVNEVRTTAEILHSEWSHKSQEILNYTNAKWYEKQDKMDNAMFSKWLAKDKGYKSLRKEADALWKSAREASVKARELVKEGRKVRADEIRTERNSKRVSLPKDINSAMGTKDSKELADRKAWLKEQLRINDITIEDLRAPHGELGFKITEYNENGKVVPDYNVDRNGWQEHVLENINNIKPAKQRGINPPMIEKEATDISTHIRKGGKMVATGYGRMVDNRLDIGMIETQPDFKSKGPDTRIMRTLVNEALKKNDKLLTVNGTLTTREGFDVVNQFGAKYYDTNGVEVPEKVALTLLGTNTGKKFSYSVDVRSNDFALSDAGKSLDDVVWAPRQLHTQEGNLRAELATGKDIASLKRMARSVGLLYKSKNNKDVSRNLTKFLSSYFGVPYKDVKKLTKQQVEEAKTFMSELVPDRGGKIRLPRTQEILPIEFFDEYVHKRGNIFDWLQSGRMAVKPIYDVFKPAYQNLLKARSSQITRLNEIYKGRVKKGSPIDKKLAQYANGELELSQIPEQYRDIAIGREKFYTEYADRLLEAGLIDRNAVFNKDGTRKRYYHRVFDNTMDRMMNEGFALDDIWMPGNLPVAGALKKRRGGREYKLSAIESDVRYVSGIEKYLHLRDANSTAAEYAKQFKGMRREMAKVYIRSMRGQPTKLDQMLQETWQGINNDLAHMLDKVGMKGTATKLRETSAPSYPISRITSPLARVYYWRYVGMALDTAMKNSIQWNHAAARYGLDNTMKAFYMQFTPEGKKLIESSGIHDEGIQRGGHFIEETSKPSKLSQIEEASYFLWTKFDYNNRNVSGLAAYYDAINKGMMPSQAREEMKKGSHETQYGYTKADSLLIDMATPLSRFVMFKKWPLAKIEMIRQWVKDGKSEAVFNLAMQEYMLYKVAQGAGVDLGNHLNALWNFATRGISSPADMIPAFGEITDIANMFAGDDAAKERVINAWQGFGNRYVSKVINFARAWHDDWNVVDHQGQLKYKSDPSEQAINLFSRSLETSKRQVDMERMRKMKDDINARKEKIAKLAIAGDVDKAKKLNREMMDKYAQDMVDYFGKKLEPVDITYVVNQVVKQKTSAHERMRRAMPGKEIAKLPKTYELKGKKRKPVNILRGF